MIRRFRSPIAAASLILLASACVFEKKDRNDAIPAKPLNEEPIAAQKSAAGLLQVNPQVRDDGLLLNIGGIPANATLECDLDDKPLVPCHDGALFLRPDVGDHKITVTALVNGQIAAIGESSKFTVFPSSSGSVIPDEAPGHAMAMALDDASFTNDMALPMGKDYTAKFKFLKKPSCEKPEVRCKYDSRTSAFWTECNDDGMSYTVSKDLMAAGRQFLSVQAHCGDDYGPILTIFWHGVPDDYKPLMIRAIGDGRGQHIVNLVRSDDCPESQQAFECAAPGSDEFELCKNANVLNNPPQGQKVRAACGDQKGPTYTFGQ